MLHPSVFCQSHCQQITNLLEKHGNKIALLIPGNSSCILFGFYFAFFFFLWSGKGIRIASTWGVEEMLGGGGGGDGHGMTQHGKNIETCFPYWKDTISLRSWMCIPGDEWLGAILTEPHIFMEKIPLFFLCCTYAGEAKAWKKRFFCPNSK